MAADPDLALSLTPPDRTDTGLHGRPPRVVLDTSVVLSALLFGGPVAGRLRRAWRHGYCRPMVCQRTLLDLTHQLGATRLGLSIAEQRRLLGEYLPYVLRVQVPATTAGNLGDQPEPASLMHVQLGLAGQAHVLVSGEASLLVQARRWPFQVLTSTAFLELLRTSAIAPLSLRTAWLARQR